MAANFLHSPQSDALLSKWKSSSSLDFRGASPSLIIDATSSNKVVDVLDMFLQEDNEFLQ